MPLSIKLPVMPDVPARVSLFVTPPPAWDPKVVADLARRSGIEAEAVDRGAWLVAQDERAALEIYQASHSLRYSVAQSDGEPRDREAADAARARSIADAWVAEFGPADTRFDVHSITESELFVATSPDAEPERFVTAVHVNYAFALGDMSVIGSGGKMQVAVNSQGEVTHAYRFWREPQPKGAVRVLQPEQAFERFAASALFSDLSDDTAKAEVTDVSIGYFALPPTEPQSVLLPVYEFRGVLSTELHPHYEFIAHLPAASVKPADVKALGRPTPIRGWAPKNHGNPATAGLPSGTGPTRSSGRTVTA